MGTVRMWEQTISIQMDTKHVMDNLGKENFWDEMENKFPMAVDVFKKWIDQYKKRVNWGILFSDGIKFHDIPYELQMGIMNRFFIETYAGEAEYMENCQSRYKEEMIRSIEQLNGRLRPMSGKN